MKKKRLLAIVGSMSLVLSLVAPTLNVAAKEQKPIVLVYADTRQVTHPWTKCVLRWQEKLTKITNGKLKFNNYYGGALIGPRKSMAEIAAGTADIGRISAFLQGGGFPIQNTSQKFFYGAKDTKTAFRIYRNALETFPEFAKEWAAGGKTLAANGPGPMHLHTTKKPVHTLDDFRGLQIRGIGSWMKSTFETLEASAISIPPSEIYIALQKNIIDGYIHPWESLKSLRLGEIAKYTTIINAFDGCGDQLLMNWDSYNRLPPDIKKVFDDSLDELQQNFVETINLVNQGALDWAKEKGHVISDLSPEELSKFYQLLEREAREGAVELDAKRFPGTKLFEFVRQEIEKSK